MTLKNHIGRLNKPLKPLFILFFALFSWQSVIAQEYINEIGGALKVGNSKVLANYFESEVDLTFSDKTNNYSKKQAVIILDRFFSKENPKIYQWMQQGASKTSNTKFSIGKLTTSTNTYKVYVFFIQKNNRYYIRELRFEK